MANTINTRIALKYDSYSNWESKNPVLLAGEVAICTVASGATKEVNSVATPQVLMKVGDGEKAFNSLPWISGLSADVYAWAKQDKINIESNGTGNVVASIGWDASANDGKGGIKYTTLSVATSEGMSELETALTALTDRVTAIEKDYLKVTDKSELEGKINAKVSTSDFETFKGTNATAIENAAKVGTDAAAAVQNSLEAYKTTTTATLDSHTTDITDLKAADVEFDGRIEALEAKHGSGEGTIESQIAAAVKVVQDDVDTLKQTQAADKTELSNLISAEASRADAAEKANKKAIDELDATLTAFLEGEAIEGSTVDTLKEIQDYITSDGTAADKMVKDIAANAAAIAAETTRATGVESDINSKIGSATLSGSSTLIEAINKNTTAIGTINNSTNGVLAQAKAYADEKATAKADAAKSAAKEYADSLNTTMDTKVENLTTAVNTKATQADLTALTGRVSTAEGKISTLEIRLNTANTEIAKKADSTTLEALTSRVTTAENNATSLDTRLGDVEGKYLALNTTRNGFVEGKSGTALELIFNCGNATL